MIQLYMNIFILVAIISIFLLATAKPKIGVYLIAVSLPVIGRNIYLGNLFLPLADLVALLVFLGFLCHLAYTFLFKPQEKIKLTWPLFFPFFLFFLVSIISILFSKYPLDSLYYFLRWPVFLYFTYIFAPFNIIKDVKTLKNTVILVFLSAILVLFSGYLSLINQDWQDAFFRLKSLYFFKSYPFGENHNLIAEFLNIGAFFVLIIKEFFTSQRLKRLADIIFLLTALGVILTFSRTGWITLLLQLLVYLYFRLKHNHQDKVAILITTFVLMIFFSPLIWKMSVLQDKNISSTENRLLLTEISWQSFQQKPVFGLGSGEFIQLVDNNIRFKAKYGEAVDSHGVLQKLLVENGFLGLAAWLFLLFYITRLCLTAIKKYYPRVKWILPFSIAALGGIFFQFFNTSYYKGRVWFPLILFLLAFKFTEQRYVQKNKNITRST